jgi:hypothetical protein
MNRLEGSLNCRVCGRSLKVDWTRATNEEIADADRQIANGLCDVDQRKRWAAATEYLRAADQIRVITQMFAAAGSRALRADRSPMLELRMRVNVAERQCVALKMWRPETVSPERFRGGR